MTPKSVALGLHLDASALTGLAPLPSRPQLRVSVHSFGAFLDIAPGAAIPRRVPMYYQHVAPCSPAAPRVHHSSQYRLPRAHIA